LKCLEDLEIKTELVTKNRVDFLSYVYDDVRMTGTYLLSQTIYKANPLPMDIYDLFHD